MSKHVGKIHLKMQYINKINRKYMLNRLGPKPDTRYECFRDIILSNFERFRDLKLTAKLESVQPENSPIWL